MFIFTEISGINKVEFQNLFFLGLFDKRGTDKTIEYFRENGYDKYVHMKCLRGKMTQCYVVTLKQ
jgi:hypothetical protein